MSPKTSTATELEIIGSTEYIEIAGRKNIPAKIDTGADTSSVWASDIEMSQGGTLAFSLFGPGSSLYTGERIKTTEYKARMVRSSHGDSQVRYRVKLPIRLGDKSFETSFTLANRSRNIFPILIGRHTLEGNFLVDVAISKVKRQSSPKSTHLNRELKENPRKFHQKYINK